MFLKRRFIILDSCLRNWIILASFDIGKSYLRFNSSCWCHLLFQIILLSLIILNGLIIWQTAFKFHLHLVPHQVHFRGVDIRVHILSLCYNWLRLYLLLREILWHSRLTVRHIDLESGVARLSIQHGLDLFDWPILQTFCTVLTVIILSAFGL